MLLRIAVYCSRIHVPWVGMGGRYMHIDSTIEQDNHCVKSMWGENHAHDIFVPLQIWLLVP
jgi:hypothetical protein